MVSAWAYDAGDKPIIKSAYYDELNVRRSGDFAREQ